MCNFEDGPLATQAPPVMMNYCKPFSAAPCTSCCSTFRNDGTICQTHGEQTADSVRRPCLFGVSVVDGNPLCFGGILWAQWPAASAVLKLQMHHGCADAHDHKGCALRRRWPMAVPRLGLWQRRRRMLRRWCGERSRGQSPQCCRCMRTPGAFASTAAASRLKRCAPRFPSVTHWPLM